MSKIISYLLPIIFTLSFSAQAQVGIGKENTVGQPHPSAMLDMDMDTDITNDRLGVLLPRIPLNDPTDRTSIPDPADYLLVFSPYTGTSSYIGLSYWHNDRWIRLLNQTELYDSISRYHIAQVILFADLSAPETNTHVTDPNNSKSYKLKLDNIIFDSQNAYNEQTREYHIPADGLYEIVCNVTLSDVSQNLSMQTFIQLNDLNVVNDLVSKTSAVTVGSVVYIAELKKGDRVCGSVGIGQWNKDTYRVRDGSLLIIKY
jgi:hypothetical protein